MKPYIIVGLLFFTYLTGSTQGKGYSGGFQLKTMLGSGVFTNDPITASTDSVNIQIQQKFGYVFGMTIRKQFNKTLAIESGLRFAQRNYSTSIDSTLASYSGQIDYRIIAYEIPIKALVRLRSSDNSFFNVALGAQLDLYPSDVFANNYEWQVEILRKSWVQGSFIANLGWEIHPVRMGTFYAGLSYNQPFIDPFRATVGEGNANFGIVSMSQTGTYFALDFRYYFEDKNQKKNEW
ncbi:MAG: hypothetical protein ACI85Q_000918 [Salibacteraceae bacterium]|jgi:hypothetical protein